MNKISREWLISISVTLGVLALLWVIGGAVAQGPEPQAVDAVNSRINYQGVLKENGVPVTGSRDMIFRLYLTDTCYPPALSSISKTGVSVGDGRFSVQLDVPPDNFNGQGLWLEVEVEGTSIGCQEILPVPYALSLRPGAVIEGVTSPSAVLSTLEMGGGWGVYGSGGAGGVQGSGGTYGVYGDGTYGVRGSGSSYGLYGSGGSYGVYGSGSSYGLYGSASDAYGEGVYGFATSTISPSLTAGVYGRSNSNDGFGLAGHNYWYGAGVGAWSYGGNLIEAYYGDYPYGTLRFRVDGGGNLWAYGTKSAMVSTEEHGNRLLYAIESPGVWFEDFGTAALAGGQAVVTIEPLFAETVNLRVEYHVFLTPLGDCQGLYVADKTPTSFEVRELGGGKADVSFDYRIVAKRLGYEDARLEEIVLPEPIEVERSEVPEPPEPEPIELPGR